MDRDVAMPATSEIQAPGLCVVIIKTDELVLEDRFPIGIVTTGIYRILER